MRNMRTCVFGILVVALTIAAASGCSKKSSGAKFYGVPTATATFVTSYTGPAHAALVEFTSFDG
ncbi:MAG: hypothetical protein E3J72_07835 [Planctomycetota bacterium]|nr:MAG: hypothetical protein E3J72_07835 [Planctomycetota bacterium]